MGFQRIALPIKNDGQISSAGIPFNIMRVNIDTAKVQEKIYAQKVRKWWLAERLDITYRTLARWLSGDIKTIERDAALKLCEVLECSFEDISLKKELSSPETVESTHASSKLLRDLCGGHLDDVSFAMNHSEFTRNTLHTLLSDNISAENLAVVLSNLCKVSFQQNDIAASLKFANRLIYYDNQKRNYTRLVETYAHAAYSCSILSKFDKCVFYFDKVRDLRDVADPGMYARVKLLYAGTCINHQREDLASGSLNEETFNVFKSRGMKLNSIKAYLLLGMAKLAQGRYEEARELFIKGTDLSKHFSLMYLFYINLYRMRCEAKLGNMEESDRLEDTLKEFPEVYKGFGAYMIPYYLAEKRILTGDYDDAERLLIKSEREAIKKNSNFCHFLSVLYSSFLELAKLRNNSEQIKLYESKVEEFTLKSSYKEAAQLRLI